MPSPSQSLKPVAWRISSDRNSIASVTDSKARADSLRKYPHAVIEPLVRLSDVEALYRPTPPEAQAGADEDLALDLLEHLFDAYENGTQCYEDPDGLTGFLGNAIRLDDKTFHACADLLNRRRPVNGERAAPKAVAQGWISVEERLPACDGETMFIGENEAGYIACFNELTPDGYCMHATAEGSICVMSGLRQWSLVNRPSSPSEEKKA